MLDLMDKKISEKISKSALYEQLAEECAELAHACLKKARKIRGENPTPLDEVSIDKQVKEEWTDVLVCADVLGLDHSVDRYVEKKGRWVKRIEASEMD